MRLAAFPPAPAWRTEALARLRRRRPGGAGAAARAGPGRRRRGGAAAAARAEAPPGAEASRGEGEDGIWVTYSVADARAAAAEAGTSSAAGGGAADSRPTIVFAAGVPGAGKTWALHQMYGRHNARVLDLDTAIQRHPAYDAGDPAAIFAVEGAYEWADNRVEEEFQRAVLEPARTVVVDGSGTKVQRRIARMRRAREAGFRVLLLYVRVRLETALERNGRRHRVVPEDVMGEYMAALTAAVEVTRAHADALVVLDNDRDVAPEELSPDGGVPDELDPAVAETEQLRWHRLLEKLAKQRAGAHQQQEQRRQSPAGRPDSAAH